MSYEDIAQRVDRSPFAYVEVDLDRCTNIYGVNNGTTSFCDAVLPAAGKQCYKFFLGCQDTANFLPEPRTFRFTDPRFPTAGMPVGYPCIDSIRLSPTRIEPGKSLGRRAAVTITLQDFEHHDLEVDDNVDDRVTPAVGGFLARLFARNRTSMLNRPLRVVLGFLEDPTQTQTRHYLIERIDGPDAYGKINILAKDVLKHADDARAQAPAPNTGALDANIDDNDLALTLSPAGVGDEQYAASGVLRVDSELMDFTRAGDAVTLTSRGAYGTSAEAHTAGSTVQQALVIDELYVHEIAQLLLEDYAGVPASYIPITDWETEVLTYLPRTYSAILSEPTGVKKLLDSLAESAPFFIWPDERVPEIKLSAIRLPSSTTLVLDDSKNVIAESVRITERLDLRISQVWVYYAIRDPIEDLTKPANFSKLYTGADTEGESLASYDSASIKKVYSRWIPANLDASATDLVNMVLGRYKKAPREVEFELDVKDSILWTGDIAYITTRQLLDKDGAATPHLIQVLEVSDALLGARLLYKGLEYFVPNLSCEGFEEVLISTDQEDLDLRAYYNANVGTPTAASKICFINDTGNRITASDQAIPAMKTGDWDDVDGAVLHFINRGPVLGAGGKGGNGAHITWFEAEPGNPAHYEGVAGTAPEKGGTAILATYPLAIDNLLGKIWSGGGGGGGGGYTANNPSGPTPKAGTGGGGGAGAIVGQGGAGGDAISSVPANDHTANPGDDGTETVGGDAGDAASGIGYDDNVGGKGGDPGEPGAAGSVDKTTNYWGGARAGGAAGWSVDGSGFVTFANLGDIRGPFNV